MAMTKWTTETERSAEVYRVINRDRPELKERLDKVNWHDPDSVMEFETWVMKELKFLPVRTRFTRRLRTYGIQKIYGEALTKQGSGWYLPFMDETSEYYAPWILFEKIEWGNPGEEGKTLRVRAVNWLIHWRMFRNEALGKKKGLEGYRKKICALIQKDLQNNLLGGLNHTYKHPYYALEEAGYDKEPWSIKFFEMKETPSGEWGKEEQRKEYFVWFTEKNEAFPADIKYKSDVRKYARMRGVMRGHMRDSFAEFMAEWRAALGEKRMFSENTVCPKCKGSGKQERRGVYKCKKCGNLFEVGKIEKKWSNEKVRHEYLVALTKTKDLFPADIKNKKMLQKNPLLAEMLESIFVGSFQNLLTDWRKALEKNKMLSKSTMCPKCTSLGMRQRIGVFKCLNKNCRNSFEVVKKRR